MKRIAVLALAAALPGMATAHGLHGPAADHAAAHAGPLVGLAVILVAAFVAARRARI